MELMALSSTAQLKGKFGSRIRTGVLVSTTEEDVTGVTLVPLKPRITELFAALVTDKVEPLDAEKV
jgi:hypothetical protein